MSPRPIFRILRILTTKITNTYLTLQKRLCTKSKIYGSHNTDIFKENGLTLTLGRSLTEYGHMPKSPISEPTRGSLTNFIE